MRAVLVALLVLYTSGIQAKDETRFESGNSLYQDMTSPSGRMYAVGYTVGIMDLLSSNVMGDSTIRTCLLGDVTAGQVFEIAKKYLEDHPEKRHYNAAGLVTIALVRAFPCDRSN